MDNDGAQIMTQAEKLASVREKLQEQGLAAFLVPRSDEHLGEYVPTLGRAPRLAHRLYGQRRPCRRSSRKSRSLERRPLCPPARSGNRRESLGTASPHRAATPSLARRSGRRGRQGWLRPLADERGRRRPIHRRRPLDGSRRHESRRCRLERSSSPSFRAGLHTRPGPGRRAV